MERDWFFYIVRCRDNSLYSGITTNTDERVKKHNDGTGAKYTAGHRPVNLVYSEKTGTLSLARKREAQVKSWTKTRKEQLVNGSKMDEKIRAYIEKQQTPQKEICLRLREIILKTFPDIKEEMKWGVPVFSGGKYYIGALRDSVHLGFSINGLSKEEIALFEGKGKTMRHIKVRTLADIDEKRIVKLLKIAGECNGSC